MPTSCCHHVDNEEAPRQVLGLGKKAWKLEQLRQILAHYRVPYCKRGTKDDLLRLLQRLSHESGLTIQDRRAILEVLRTRAPPPSSRWRRVVAIMVPPVRPAAVVPAVRPAAMTPVMRPQAMTEVELEPHIEPEPDMEREPDVVIIDDSAEESGMECSICMEKCSEDQIPSRRVTAGCNHDRDVCIACVRQSISAQFQVKMWNQLSCPCCAQLLRHEDVKEFGDPVIFERYESLLSSLGFSNPHMSCLCNIASLANSTIDTTKSA